MATKTALTRAKEPSARLIGPQMDPRNDLWFFRRSVKAPEVGVGFDSLPPRPIYVCKTWDLRS